MESQRLDWSWLPTMELVAHGKSIGQTPELNAKQKVKDWWCG
jgi:hypothetical protein